MVILIRIPSFAYCSLHSGQIQSASWTIFEADCKICYAALRAAALEKSATTTLSVAFNLVCSLITENSARTRNPDLPITTSKPVHSQVIFNIQCAYLQYKLSRFFFQLKKDLPNKGRSFILRLNKLYNTVVSININLFNIRHKWICWVCTCTLVIKCQFNKFI